MEQTLKELQEWLDSTTSHLSTRTDYAAGYKAGIEQAKVIVQHILNQNQ